MKKKIILVDGHNLLFRVYYGIPASIKNSKGIEIKGLIGFIGSIKKIVNEFNPFSIVVIFDSESSREKNLKLDDNYKSNRKDYTYASEDDNPFSQLPLIKKALNYLNIYNMEIKENEADDFISSIIFNNIDYEYIIFSTDSDFIQLINENVSLYVPRGKNSILYDYKQIINKYNIPPNKYILFKSLIGDNSDNIKGIRGIGAITAAKILKYNSIDEYIYSNDNTRISNLLSSNRGLINKNIKLITLNNTLNTSDVLFNKINNKIHFKTYEIINNIGFK